ncbi:MAG TPA: glycosyltransferase family 2 protein [Anaeromyxobacteraceae bacterium]|nr:glycosyltransferase family 2 protein [Anaeromyxobacteraceae bacterium]
MGPQAAGDAGPLVSMVVTTYRAVDHLGCLVRGLLRRPPDPDLEVVIYGDGGGEPSRAAIEACRQALASAGHRVVARYEPVNRGIVPALNAACRLAAGRWLFVVNDDMVFADGWLDEVRPALAPGRVLSVTCAEPPLPGRRIAAVTHARDLGLDPTAFDYEALQRFCREAPGDGLAPGVHYPFLVERARYEELGGADEGFPGPYHDPDLFLRFRLRGLELVRLRRCLAYHFSGVSLRFTPGEAGPAAPPASARQGLTWVRKENAARLHFVRKWGAKPRAPFGEVPGTRASAPWAERAHGPGERLAYLGLLAWEWTRCRVRELARRGR